MNTTTTMYNYSCTAYMPDGGQRLFNICDVSQQKAHDKADTWMLAQIELHGAVSASAQVFERVAQHAASGLRKGK